MAASRRDKTLPVGDAVRRLLSLVPELAYRPGVLRRSPLSPEGWTLERLTYFVLFPPLMFMSIVEGRSQREALCWA
jgi:hypothetical protein